MGTSPNSTVRLPLPEQILSEKYRLLSRLGQGGMGYVFLAEETPDFIAKNLISRLRQYAATL